MPWDSLPWDALPGPALLRHPPSFRVHFPSPAGVLSPRVSPGLSLMSPALVPVWEQGTDGSCLVQTPLAQRLMMQESSLAQFALQSAASLPAITLGLPATTGARVGGRVVPPAPGRGALRGFPLGLGFPALPMGTVGTILWPPAAVSLFLTPSPSPQGEAERRALPSLAHRVPVLNGPVLQGTHSPVFIPAGLEQHEAGSPLSPRLQPVIILEPSVTHAPLVAGEDRKSVV